MNYKKNIVNVFNGEGFSPNGEKKDGFQSRLLIDNESVDSKKLVMSHYTLKKGKKNIPCTHGCPYDEIYYILKGNAILYIGEPVEKYHLSPNTAVFIPCGTRHGLKNIGNEDFELLGIFAGPLKQGINPIYDGRKKQWGKTFKLHESDFDQKRR